MASVLIVLSLALLAQGWNCHWFSKQVAVPRDDASDPHVYTVAQSLNVNWTSSNYNCTLNGQPSSKHSWTLSKGNITCMSNVIKSAICTLLIEQSEERRLSRPFTLSHCCNVTRTILK